jgi:hypothetical protein
MQQSDPSYKNTNVFTSLKVFVTCFKMSLIIYIRFSWCYMFRPHLGHHQAHLLFEETTALYTLSSVSLGTSLFPFVGYFHPSVISACEEGKGYFINCL